MNDIFERNPNLKFLTVVLVSAALSGTLVMWESPSNPLQSLATVISVSASVPPNGINAPVISTGSSSSGRRSPNDASLSQEHIQVSETAAQQQIESAVTHEDAQQDSIQTPSVQESSRVGVRDASIRDVFASLAGFGSIGATIHDPTVIERIETLLTNNTLSTEEVQKLYTQIDAIIEDEQEGIQRETYVEFQVGLIVFAVFLTGGAGAIMIL